MTAQFLGYQHYNRYRNEFDIVGATSAIDFDYKRLDTLQAALEDIYEDDGLEINMGLHDECRDSKAFDILIQRLKEAAAFWLDKHGYLSSQFLATGGQKYGEYDNVDDYIADIVKKIDRRVERDDYQWEWDCFTEQLQYLLDELMEEAHKRHPHLPKPDHIHVDAHNIDWRGRSGMLVCKADAVELLQKVTGSHNSPEYHFYWGEQRQVVDDYGNAAMFSEKKFLRMIMPHHDAVTSASIEAVWSDHLGDPISESELDAARAITNALHATTRRIYGADRYDRIGEEFGMRFERPAIYHIVGFDSRSFIDEDTKILSDNTAAEHMDSLMSDLWFWVKQNYGEEHATYQLASDYYHTAVAHYVCYPEIFRDLTIQVIEAIENDNANEEV